MQHHKHKQIQTIDRPQNHDQRTHSSSHDRRGEQSTTQSTTIYRTKARQETPNNKLQHTIARLSQASIRRDQAEITSKEQAEFKSRHDLDLTTVTDIALNSHTLTHTHTRMHHTSDSHIATRMTRHKLATANAEPFCKRGVASCVAKCPIELCCSMRPTARLQWARRCAREKARGQE